MSPVGNSSSAQMASGGIGGSSEEILQMLLNSEFYKIVRMSDAGPDFIKRKMGDLERSKFKVNSIYGGDTTALHVACEFGNLELVEYLLHHPDIDVNKKDALDGDTAVHTAAVGGEVPLIRRLLARAQCGPFDVNNRGRSPLHLALGKGRVEMARFLIDQNCDLHQKDRTGATPLHFAARNGNKELLQLLEEKVPGIDVNQKSHAGLTALHYAAWNDRAEAVEWLCARENIKLDEADSVDTNTPLHWAAQGGHWEVVEVLVKAHLARGTILVFKENRHKETVLELMERHAPFKLILLLRLFNKEGLLDMKAFPPIVLVKFVMGYGDASMIQSLEQALEYAVEKEKLEDSYLSALRRLLASDSGCLCWLAERGNKESALLYLKLKDEEHLKLDDFGHSNVATALRNAILKGNTEFASVLAEQGMMEEVLGQWFDRMDKDLTGNLLGAAKSMFDMLGKRKRAGLTTPEELFEDIPLAFWIFEATEADKQRMVQFLEKHKAWHLVINKKGQKTKRTALHWAYIFRRSETTAKLSQLKERTRGMKDVYGKTASKYATKYRQEERSVYIDALKSILVAAALMASIEFTGFVMSQPLGYPSVREAAASVNRSMQIFWVCSCSAFFLAMASGLACLGGMLPMPDVDFSEVVGKTARALLMASALLVVSICFALSAFFCGIFADVPSKAGTRRYRKEMFITSAVGFALCAVLVLWFFHRSWPLLRHMLPSPSRSWQLRRHKQTDKETATADNRATAAGRVACKVGPRYKEYPWEDGLDELHKQLEQEAGKAAAEAKDTATAQDQSGRSSTEDDNRQLLAPHRRSPHRPGRVHFTHICGDASVTYL